MSIRLHRLPGWIMCAVLLAGGMPAAMADRAVADPDSGDRAGRQAVDFAARPLAGPGEVRLSDFAGDVVLLNFWASWCYPCRYEMAHFEKLYTQLHGEGFTVVAVAVYDKFADARAFQQEYNFSFPVLFDHAEQAKDAFNIEVVPQTFLISRSGELLPIPDPGTGEVSYVVNDPMLWEHPDTLSFLQQVVRQ